MIRSMTGYGRAQKEVSGMNISVELKGVNHRYFEFSTRVFRNYSFLEEKIKSHVHAKVARGKIECFVHIEALESDDVRVLVNHSLASGFIEAYKELAERYNIPNDTSVSLLSRQNEVLHISKAEADEEAVWQAVLSVLDPALDRFINMRQAEGQNLKEDILSRAEAILLQLDFIEKRSPETLREYNEKLLSRLKDLLQDTSIDEQRILTEAAIFADKIAVAEEITRLRSHIDQLLEFMSGGKAGGVGKTLDFLVQEMNREINTIGSKAADVEISKAVIAVKAEIEKIREQVQNIE